MGAGHQRAAPASGSPLDLAQRRHLRREVAVSAAINAAFSALFAWGVFGGRAAVGLWGTDGLAFDFLPQTFAVGLMATLVPTLLTRGKLRRGELARAGAPGFALPRNVLLRALLLAGAAVLVCGGLGTLALAAAADAPLRFAEVFALKVAYGAAVGALVTAVAVRAALADGAGAAA